VLIMQALGHGLQSRRRRRGSARVGAVDYDFTLAAPGCPSIHRRPDT
jgi:hypothetical protein